MAMTRALSGESFFWISCFRQAVVMLFVRIYVKDLDHGLFVFRQVTYLVVPCPEYRTIRHEGKIDRCEAGDTSSATTLRGKFPQKWQLLNWT